MIGNIIGVMPVRFVNSDTGEVVQGTRLYVVNDDLDVFGKSCNVIWAASGTPLHAKLNTYLSSIGKDGKPENLVGCDVDFSFKPKSKQVAQFEIITKK